MKMTSVFNKNIIEYNKGTRIISNKGGTRSSKTWSLLQLLYMIALKSKKPILISIVSESMPHLKRGCIRDFKDMLDEESLWDDNNWNATDKIYKINLSTIEFFSADSSGKVRGPARDILFVNECNNINYETIRQLMVRTRKTVFFDYNPCEEFWMEDNILNRESGFQLIHSTYKDNEFLTREQIEEIEANKHDADWWNVFGLGITGNREGLCIKNWVQIDSMPENYKKRWIGLDFGYSNDPTAIVDMRLANGELWIDELCYKRGMLNKDIFDFINDTEISGILIVADSAEPKSIAELRRYGLTIEAALKGSDSVSIGISTLNRYKINVTKKSLNTIKELRNYKWQQDDNGKFLNKPIDKFNHSIDAARYIALNKLISPRI